MQLDANIEPDSKDWTWVLEQQCPDCGFDASSFDPATTSSAVLDNAMAWLELLDDPRASQRPSPTQWSAVEYACHVRDVFTLFARRLDLMLTLDDPLFENWDQDVTAIEQDYAHADAGTVVQELHVAARDIAARFGDVTAEQWERTGRRSDGAKFTVASFAKYFMHDPVHHVHDVRQGYESLRP
ncbi:MAG TPA: DinB family protein [Ilumatobacter sp.]|nr:DinB family protein [Ilumatobacter sp.]